MQYTALFTIDLSAAMVQADPTNVRAATRAATCHIKMGQLAEATAVLEAVRATVCAGHPVPPDLASKQSDLELTKRMVAEVLHLHVTAVSTICAGPSAPLEQTEQAKSAQMCGCRGVVSVCDCCLDYVWW